jgi:ABC-type glycerol-3-phosphate transport system substrate-binding protein
MRRVDVPQCERIDRRAFVRALTAGGVAGLAGCSGGSGDADGNGNGNGDDGGGDGDGRGGDAGGDGGDTDTEASSDDGGGSTDTLTVMGFRELEEGDPEDAGSVSVVYNSLINQFEDETGIDVDYRFISIEDYRTQGLSIIDSSEAPAVFETLQGPGSVGQYVDVGAVADIRDAVDASVWETRNAEAWTFGGGDIGNIGAGEAVYGAPNQVSGFPLWFSVPVLEEAGIDVERVRHANDVTWTEFEEMCAQIRDAGFVPLALGNRVGGHMDYLLHCAFTKSVEYDTLLAMARGESNRQFTDQVFLDAVERIQGWWENDYINSDTLSLGEDEAEQLIFQQQAAFMTDGIWISYLYYVVDPDDMGPLGEGWDYMWWPYRPDVFEGGRNTLFGHPNGAWSVSSRAQDNGQLDAAAEFIEHWSGLEQEEFRSSNANILPAHNEADAFFNETSQAMYDDLTASETTMATMRPDQLFGPDVSQVIADQATGLFSGATSPQELLAAMEDAR